MRLHDVSISLPSGDGFGWGVCGDQLARHLSLDGAKAVNLPPNHGYVKANGTVLQAIANHEFGYTSPLLGKKNVGYGFIENDILAAKFAPLAERMWDHIVCGSTWMKEWLKPLVNVPVSTVIQGVDPDCFYWKSNDGWDLDSSGYRYERDFFTVGSFGKFEYRKAQDVVIRVVKLFQEKHDDVRLLFNWTNKWPGLIQDFTAQDNGGILGIKFPEVNSSKYWFLELLEENGIHEDTIVQYHNVPYFGQRAMYAECDVALFPNRLEGGTSLPFMECLAVGVPCIVADAHGHKDITRHPGYPCKDLLLRGGTPYVYNREDVDIGNFTEPCLDEMLSQLEYAYQQRAVLRSQREAISKFGRSFTWAATADNMAKVLQ